uniref:Uncharacterized protein n=1 Tax=Timema bartmani TaxID=61472 RepID=A0A7R9F6Y6_9NEOP|nr:unnamed protein product [Timema bartmani]
MAVHSGGKLGFMKDLFVGENKLDRQEFPPSAARVATGEKSISCRPAAASTQLSKQLRNSVDLMQCCGSACRKR